MAWNPSPKVAWARNFADEFDMDQMIVISLNRKTNRIEYASYGKTKRLCAEAKRLADVAFEAVQEKI